MVSVNSIVMEPGFPSIQYDGLTGDVGETALLLLMLNLFCGKMEDPDLQNSTDDQNKKSRSHLAKILSVISTNFRNPRTILSPYFLVKPPC